jgi:hypothetical protein
MVHMSRKTEIRKDVKGMNVGGWRVMGVGNEAYGQPIDCTLTAVFTSN